MNGMTQDPHSFADLCSSVASVEATGWSKVDTRGYHKGHFTAAFIALSSTPDIIISAKIQSIQAH